MDDSSDIKKIVESKHCFYARLAHARFCKAGGRNGLPLGTLPFWFWVVFEHPEFDSGYNKVKTGRIIFIKLQKFFREPNIFGTSFAQIFCICKSLVTIPCIINVDMFRLLAIFWWVKRRSECKISHTRAHVLALPLLGVNWVWARLVKQTSPTYSSQAERAVVDSCVRV